MLHATMEPLQGAVTPALLYLERAKDLTAEARHSAVRLVQVTDKTYRCARTQKRSQYASRVKKWSRS